jgi:hypothetical protein
MERFARGQWSDNEILGALSGKDGTLEITFRADVLKNGVKTREAELAPGGEVTMEVDNEIARKATIVLYEEIDPLDEEIKPYMLLRMDDLTVGVTIVVQTCAERDALDYTCAQWDALDYSCAELDAGVISSGTRIKQYAEFPLGVFIAATPTRTSEDGAEVWSIEAYDRTIILSEDGFEAPYYIAAGEKYIDAVVDILVSAGITNVVISDYSETRLPADREFDVGTTKLEAANALLSEISYNPVYCDVEGRFVIEAHKEISPARIDFTYRADDMSTIGLNTESETDYYQVPNVFIATCTNPDLDVDYRSVYINDNPASAYSTVRRGRRIISEIYQPEQIAGQEELDAYIRREAYERIQAAGETITFATALMPVHGRADTIALQHPDASGTFREIAWTLPLEAGGEMEHVARRAVML